MQVTVLKATSHRSVAQYLTMKSLQEQNSSIQQVMFSEGWSGNIYMHLHALCF